MKNLLVKILFVVVGLVIGSCSQSEIEEQVLKPSVEQVQMEELIQYVEDINLMCLLRLMCTLVAFGVLLEAGLKI